MIRISIALFLTALFAAKMARADNVQSFPSNLNNVGVDQHLGDTIPLDLVFHDENGADVTLAQCVHNRPVLLTPVYYQCPMLCSLTLNQLARSLNTLHENAGQDFEIITFSFDPKETPQLAAAKKASYLHMYSRPTAAAGWHFLTGSQESIDRLTKAAGFNYHWDPESKTYSHATAVLVLTPAGKISRYFLGIDFPATQIRQALVDATSNTIGHPAEQIFLYCFHYDPSTGRYGLIIMRTIRVLGIATLLGLVSLIVGNMMRERRQRS